MSRNTPAIVAIALLVVAITLHFLWVSSARKEAKVLSETISQMRDSLDSLHRVVASLKEQAPGLGEYMSTIQLHIAKLWFAGQAANWKLAKYEHDELNETIEAAEGLHARKNNVDITAVLQSVQQTQLPLIEQAISKKNLPAFNNTYSQTLAACNGCHRPAGYEFIHIITPTREPVTNQLWNVNSR
jgi:hypothetical protein